MATSLKMIMPPNSSTLISSQKPIAPRLRNRSNGSESADAVSSSTGNHGSNNNSSAAIRGCRRKIAFHPTLGYAIPPPQPAKVQRRNARERNRVKQVNCGFEFLRNHIPSAAKNKKMSKVDTLKHAVEYIQSLQSMLAEQQLSKSSIKTFISNHVVINNEDDDDGNEDDENEDLGNKNKQKIGSNLTRLEVSPKSRINLSASSREYVPNQSNPHLLLMQPPCSLTNVGNRTVSSSPSMCTPPDAYTSPLTPHTPNSPSDIYGSQYNGSNESGYETPSYYTNATPSMVSPNSNTQMLQQLPMHQIQGYNCHQPMYPQHRDSLSPTSSSVYSEVSYCSSNRFAPNYMCNFSGEIVASNGESLGIQEDELLDAIVKWQEN